MIIGARNWQQMPKLAYTQCWQGKPNSAIEAILYKHNVASFPDDPSSPLPKNWLETCGSHSAANCSVAIVADPSSWLGRFATPGGQLLRPPDVLTMWMNEPKNQRILDTSFPAADPMVMDNEYRKEYPLSVKNVFGIDSVYVDQFSFAQAIQELREGHSIELGLAIGHFIAAYAYDDSTNELIYADPADYRHPDGHYADARMGIDEYQKTVTPAVVVYRGEL